MHVSAVYWILYGVWCYNFGPTFKSLKQIFLLVNSNLPARRWLAQIYLQIGPILALIGPTVSRTVPPLKSFRFIYLHDKYYGRKVEMGG